MLEVALEFLKIGCFSFGGAYGAIPMIRDMVIANGYLTQEELAHLIAVSESTPGPIMVNLATYVGHKCAGLPGAILASVAVVLPSFAAILLVTAMLRPALKNRIVQAALAGIKPCIIGVVIAVGLQMMGQTVTLGDARGVILLAALLALTFLHMARRKKPVNAMALIGIAAVLGVVVYGL